MRRPGDDECVSIVLAIEEEIRKPTLGVRGMSILAKEAARIIRCLRTDIAFKEDEHGS
jgi:hypothetical protein